MTTRVLTLAVLLSLTPPLSLHADVTYVWNGSDSRFSARFTISDADFARGAFTNQITSFLFQFQDSQNPSINAVFSDPRGLYQGNFGGELTADRQHLSHAAAPNNPNVSFVLAAWQFPGIQVGMYSYNKPGDPTEVFEYKDYNRNLAYKTTGNWSLVPEPSSSSMLWLGALSISIWNIGGIRRVRSDQRSN